MIPYMSTCIPFAPREFNSYILNTSTHLKGSAERLGVEPSLVTAWDGFNARWTPLYEKYLDEFNSRTPAVISQMTGIIEEVHQFEDEKHMIAKIAISPNVTAVDLEIFNINMGRRQSRSVPQTPIKSQPLVVLKPIGGGTIDIRCYGAGKRAAIIDEADCIQYRYAVGAIPPPSVEEASLQNEISSKAAFLLKAGAENEGIRLYIYFRWYNTRHPDIAGPWSSQYTTIIL